MSNDHSIHEPLPHFKYYKDPIATGIIAAVSVDEDEGCLVCERQRGYYYTQDMAGEVEYELCDLICPWCIHDGGAYKKFKAACNDVFEIWTISGEEQDRSRLPDGAFDELNERTPAIPTAHIDRWMACCDDFCRYINSLEGQEFAKQYPELIPFIAKRFDLPIEQVENMTIRANANDNNLFHVFECLHCQRLGALLD